MIKAVIFDLDGVLADSEKYWNTADAAVLEKYGAVFDESFIPTVMGNTIKESSEAYVKKYRLPIRPNEFSQQRIETLKKIYETANDFLMPGAFEILEKFKSRMKIGLASGSPLILVEAVLQKHRIAPFFNVVISGDMVDKGKPAPDIYEFAIRKLGLAPKECFAVEDSPNGVKAAKAAGLVCIALKTPFAKSHDISSADKIISHLLELPVAMASIK